MISPGGADVLLAMEPAEALRYVHYLSPDGVALVNTRPVMPVTVTTGQARYPSIEEILVPLREACSQVWAMDATGLAATAGSPQATNVVMLGALSRHLPIEEATLRKALSETVPARFLEINMKAFELGKIEVE